MTLSSDDLKTYRALVTDLEADLHSQVDTTPQLASDLQDAWQQARDKERTGDSFAEWLDAYLTQIAVAWVLTTIFARYLEDNELISEPRIAASPTDAAKKNRVDDTYRAYFRDHPLHSDTDYLLHFFRHLADLPAGEVFGEQRNPLYRLEITGDAGRKLLRFFRHIDPDTGLLDHSFDTTDTDHTDQTNNTRFLGDLYQDLSEDARKRYALLQTPDFVEEFILEHTLIPAIDTFGLDEVRFIDPTCGSGHFLLGGFHLLLDKKLAARPSENRTILVREALDATYGVDLNPFAVSIARFRLTIAALFALGDAKPQPGARAASPHQQNKPLALDKAPALPLNIAVGDSLIHGRQFPRFATDTEKLGKQGDLFRYRLDDRYNTEDNDLIFGDAGILMQQYHAVVGNPPYITVKDSAANEIYRRHYDSCYRRYALVAPFFERFFDLAIGKEMQGEEAGLLDWQNRDVTPGYVGMIVANSFMKRQFGQQLIEDFIPKTDVTHVIDTSGAYIPGHGTPTVVVFGRNQDPQDNTLRTVLGIRGEPKNPENAAEGLVWSSIAKNIAEPGFENDFITVEDSGRELFHEHPWTLRGGGALQAKTIIEEVSGKTIDELADCIGFASFTGQDDAFVFGRSVPRTYGIPDPLVRDFVYGEVVRNWAIIPQDQALVPYDRDDPNILVDFDPDSNWGRRLWPLRTMVLSTKSFGGRTRGENGEPFWSWYRWIPERYRVPLSITFAEVATHNHFVLDRGGKVFKQTAPVIKLPEDATVDDHLGLLGLLNSSTGEFFMQMVFHNKGGPGGASSKDEKWHDFYQRDGTKMKTFPIPEGRPVDLARRLDDLGQQLALLDPTAIAEREIPHPDRLDRARDEGAEILTHMVALQEELDWKCYGFYGLLDDPPLADIPDELPRVKRGERAFEIVLARKMKEGTVNTKWFTWFDLEPITEIPRRWPQWYRDLVQRRIDRIADTRFVRLIEQPEFKRRWNIDPWKKREKQALETWLLDRLETARYFPNAPDAVTLTSDPDAPRDDSTPAELTTIAEIAREAQKDEDFLQVATRYTGDPTFDVEKLVEKLILDNAVPYLPSQRYKKSGIRRRKEWEQVWHLQRQEDAIDARTELPPDHPDHLTEKQAQALKKNEVGKIPKPPNYRKSDFQSGTIYTHRGKLDVPRERFTLYPDCQTPEGSPRITWAGLNHLQRARALATFYYHAKDTLGWPPQRLLPLLAGLQDLLPWLHQWHPQPDPDFGTPFADFLEAMLDEQARELGFTPQEIETTRLG